MATFMRNINLIAQSGSLFRERKLAGLGLNGCQTKYILAVCCSEGVSQDAIARRLFVNKSNVARQMALLEEAGYVVRRQSESDKRTLLLYSTEKGKDAFSKIREVNAEWRALLTADFTEEEKRELFRLTEKLYANAERIVREET